MQQVELALLAFVSDEILSGRDAASVNADDDLLGGGLVDSLSVMRIISFLEERYQVSIPPEDVTIEHFMTIRHISSYLQDRLSAAGESA